MANSSDFAAFCGSPIWNANETWDTESPHLSVCVQWTFARWIPHALLLLCLPLYLPFVCRSKKGANPWTKLNGGRMVITGLVILTVLMDVWMFIHEVKKKGLDLPSVFFVSPLIQTAGFVLVIAVQEVERRKGYHTSIPLFFFWLFAILCGVVPLNSYVQSAMELGYFADEYRFTVFVVYFSFVLIQFILCCVADVDPAKRKIINGKRQSPEGESSFFSDITYWWLTGLIFRGFKKPLTEKNLWAPDTGDLSANIVPRFEKVWQKELQEARKKLRQSESARDPNTMPLLDEGGTHVAIEQLRPSPSLIKVLAKVFGPHLLKSQFNKLLSDVLQFVSPMLLQLLIGFTNDVTQPIWRGYIYAVLFFVVAVLQSFFLNYNFHVAFRVGMHIKSAVIGAVYNKALTMSNEARKDSTVGEIVNLMSVDAQRLQETAAYVSVLWSAPVQIVIAIVLLTNVLGHAIWAGVGVIVLLIPLNFGIGIFQRRFQIRLMGLKDGRIKLMNEVFNGMKVLKLYAWEIPFREKVADIRGQELDTLKKIGYLNSIMTFSFTCTPYLVTLATFAAYIFTSEEKVLDAEKAFVSLSLFNILRMPIMTLPMMITMLVQANVSVKRVSKFLSHSDIDTTAIKHDKNSPDAVSIVDGTLSWASDETPCLKGLNVNVPKGSLVAVVGLVGSGKSSFIASLLGETVKVKGEITTQGSVAYVAQQAWIQNATVRNNILFGKRYRRRDYEKVVETCALKTDLEILQGGDRTEIGEKGVNLSGGQKQRISLARAVYQDADMYLLDDPLSALDAHVGKHIFKNVISSEGVLKDKTRILVTHGVQWLPEADMVIVLDHGKVEECGTYDELLSHDGPFAQFLKAYFAQLADADEDRKEEEKEKKEGETEGEQKKEDDSDEEMAQAAMQVYKRLETVCKITDDTCADDLPPWAWKMRGVSPCPSGPGSQQCLTDDQTCALDPPTTDTDKQILSPTPSKSTVVRPPLVRLFSRQLTRQESRASLHSVSTILSGVDEKVIRDAGKQKARQHGFTLIDNDPAFFEPCEEVEEEPIEPEKKKDDDDDDDEEPEDLTTLIEVEKMESGKVKLSVFWTYAKALGVNFTVLFFLFFILFQAASVFANMWLSKWTDDQDFVSGNLTKSEMKKKNDLYLGVYGAAGVAQAVCVLIYALIAAISMVKAAGTIHKNALTTVMRAPMSFFDTTPIGRLVNRFSNDVATLDVNLPMSIRQWMNTFFSVVSTIVVISYTTPLFIAVIIPVLLLYYFIQVFYIPTTRQLKRLESTTRSPIYTHFSETVTGAATVRAFGHVQRFEAESQKRVDDNLVAYFAGVSANRWLSVRLDWIGNIIVMAAALFAVIGRGNGIGGGMVGLSVSYALQVTFALNWMVRMTSDLESNIVSVERLKEYTEIPSEAEWTIESSKPPSSWPDSGAVKCEDYCTRYREGLDLVLRGVTCDIPPGNRVGIVGRTGAGKSSMTLALFRLIEPAGGKIRIDGLDISTLGLHQLRSKLTILPQDPVLFSGSMRMNLDPFGTYDDERLWTALEQSNLSTYVQGLPSGLDFDVGEGGQNLSMGQRQMVCLARTLLRKTKILVLDEATAAVDYETDELIQQTIRREFADCTILTIAHRINTIMDSDKIMVLDRGLIAEFDSPQELLQNKESIFYGMAKEAGVVH